MRPVDRALGRSEHVDVAVSLWGSRLREQSECWLSLDHSLPTGSWGPFLWNGLQPVLLEMVSREGEDSEQHILGQIGSEVDVAITVFSRLRGLWRSQKMFHNKNQEMITISSQPFPKKTVFFQVDKNSKDNHTNI